jgi:hypothetical protein
MVDQSQIFDGTVRTVASVTLYMLCTVKAVGVLSVLSSFEATWHVRKKARSLYHIPSGDCGILNTTV